MTGYYTNLIPGAQPADDDPNATRPYPVVGPQPAPPQDTPPPPPASDGQPPRKRHRVRNAVLLTLAGATAIGIIASAAGGASRPAATVTPAPASSAPATPAQPATASGYLTAHGYTPVLHWSYDKWQKENKGAAKYDPYIARGADVVAAGKNTAGSGAIVVKLADPKAGPLAGIVAGMSSVHAKIDGTYLVASFAVPSPAATPATTAPASSAPAQAPASSAPAQAPAAPAGPTVSQQQALTKAQEYLDMGGFSHDGLIDQLTSQAEKFSEADATWAVDHTGADWNAQAVIKAKEYMQMGGFSRGSLIDQLTSSAEKFTYAQATYAANQVGL